MITISGLEKSFGDRVLFEQVDLQLNAGSRYGVVGANGGGKSTFLRILMGEEHETAGAVAIPKSARVGMLRQDRFLNDEEAVVRVAMRGDEAAFAALDELERLAQQDDPDPERLGACDEVLHATGGYGLEARASQILVGLGVDESSLREPLGRLSGGYKLRVLLAQVLVGGPDVLLLDEPTNHLDILSIRWLEGLLSNYQGCAVVISHDRGFLDRTSTNILDVDYGTVTLYTGNYTAFVAQKDETGARSRSASASGPRPRSRRSGRSWSASAPRPRRRSRRRAA
jgi:ATPase subunit of ABC transporter with duplicated ATPase domains